MENASKALVMAGSVLIGLVIISLLVFFYDNLKRAASTEYDVVVTAQTTEFNKQFDVYNRTIYGSELLSIANKIQDYNTRQASAEGYEKIELEVKINTDINSTYLKAGTYNSVEIVNAIEAIQSAQDSVGNKLIKFEKGTKKIKELALMRTKDIVDELGNQTNLGERYQTYIAQYNTYKSLITEIKSKRFKCKDFDYDKNNGRIIKMKYEI